MLKPSRCYRFSNKQYFLYSLSFRVGGRGANERDDHPRGMLCLVKSSWEMHDSDPLNLTFFFNFD